MDGITFFRRTIHAWWMFYRLGGFGIFTKVSCGQQEISIPEGISNLIVEYGPNKGS